MNKIIRPKSKQPIPKHATKVFSGITFDVYQWQQKQFDGSFATYEKVARQDSVVVIPITKDGKIIITEQEQPGKEPFIDFAGGVSDDGEDPESGARRELLEETGYKAGDLKLWYAIQPVTRVEWSIYTFIAYDCVRVSQQTLDPGEKIKIELIDFDEFIDITSGDNLRDLDTTIKVLKAKLDPQKMDELKKLFTR
jgi:ADP-ribose pyrophosphatase